ncbi:arabinan endo-1,5-alpha-L-arabinosidase [Demequina sp. SYSU T00039]|uniref:Arabinan endo-1,5-alpha-L-arabinosidase n=1 Tax=Demequina lignilytica TaxID=3051663 RepID=A0AAW7M2L1_9MICO|nr:MULTISPECIES: arabinan endo-1,5-alpha-L-arabinosidase [unclassified Demequina]MDN4479227.1 arabinan endo-1,5-alpha-L-arabinosidase [Demequina sp. SYSU T00039-1]MDN4487914.1 arabinan endo-1,5-alpha-L-arabinosidase [Demequina sp. SYSU T00039]MDN4491720.1 arabinan endo-1,5-alpha-L-arabinosidase [Demequina sp. SYSU T00068]
MTRRRTLLFGAAAAVALTAVGVGTWWWAPWDEADPAGVRIDVDGDIRTHDPALVAGTEDHDWYVYSTGDVQKGFGSPQIRRSTDGETWEYVGTVWDKPDDVAWVYEEVSGLSNFWAPEVLEHDGTWYLYYSASTFGSNASVIGLMTSPTLDPDDPDYGWTDQGLVWRSTPGESTYNAIDPGVITDEDGTPWMAFGSFWGGIQLIELEWPSGKPIAGAEPVMIAHRTTATNAIEAPYLAYRDGWYYLFVSRDSCCQGTESTYSIAVGRAETITGPYLDSWGNDMRYDGGDELLSTRGSMIGPGGQSYSDGYLALHYYDGDDGGDFRLEIRRLGWTDDGWPVAWTAEELAD